MSQASDRRELQDIQDEVDDEQPHHYCIKCLSPAYLSTDPDMCACCMSSLTKRFPDTPPIPTELFKASIQAKIDRLDELEKETI